MTLKKCALCENMEDPRFGYTYLGRSYPLCDGCGGPENVEQRKQLRERLSALPWSPPFCATLIEDVACPQCEAESVHVREHETYLDSSDYEAFCGDCHAMLTVFASVDVAFHEPELRP
jgi:hypothetical protein